MKLRSSSWYLEWLAPPSSGEGLAPSSGEGLDPPSSGEGLAPPSSGEGLAPPSSGEGGSALRRRVSTCVCDWVSVKGDVLHHQGGVTSVRHTSRWTRPPVMSEATHFPNSLQRLIRLTAGGSTRPLRRC